MIPSGDIVGGDTESGTSTTTLQPVRRRRARSNGTQGCAEGAALGMHTRGETSGTSAPSSDRSRVLLEDDRTPEGVKVRLPTGGVRELRERCHPTARSTEEGIAPIQRSQLRVRGVSGKKFSVGQRHGPRDCAARRQRHPTEALVSL